MFVSVKLTTNNAGKEKIMTAPQWQLQAPLDAIIFDCDGTLTTIEGIDEIARQNGVSSPVEALTATAMGTTGLNPQLYHKRMELVLPQREQVLALGTEYFSKVTPDAYSVIQLLQRLQKKVYIVSAGLYPAVKIFGELLQVPSHRIFAVEVMFDKNGNYVSYDQESPFTRASGKRDIVMNLQRQHLTTGYVGDGMNDLAARDIVTRFIGFGGIYFRENIADKCDFYISTPSLSVLVPLLLTAAEIKLLTEPEQVLSGKGFDLIESGAVNIKT
jgi:phosphoserine phosphatase